MTTPEIRRELQRINWNRAPAFFFLMLGLEPLSIFGSDLPHWSSPTAPAYLTLHLGLWLLAVGALAYWAMVIRPGRWRDPAPVEWASVLIGTLGLTMIAAVTVVDLAGGGAATPFLANLLVCAAMALVPFPGAVFVYAVPTGVFFAGSALFPGTSAHLATDLADTAIFLVAALFIARFQFQNQVRLLTKNAELDFLSRHDPLTGLANRAEFQARLDWELAALRRSGGVASLVLVDLDRFKAINDRFGHPAGDLVLQEAARVLKAGTRDVDCVARWGGEEFLLLLTETPPQEAVLVAERLRAGFERTAAPIGQPLPFTASFGVTALTLEGNAPFQDAYARADAALYLAKAGGRNRVEVNPRPLG